MNILLEEDRAETRIKRANPLILQDLPKATNKAIRKSRRRDETDPGRLQGTQGNRGEELRRARRDHVYRGAVVFGRLCAKAVANLLLEELVSSELEGALHEVARKGGAEARRERADALALDDLAEAIDHATVVGCRVKLDPSLDAVWEKRIFMF